MDLTLKNLILAGIGTVAYTYEKSAEMIGELVKKGELTVNQGKQLNEELKRNVSDRKASGAGSSSVTMESLKELLDSLNLATKDDLGALKERIDKLENK